VAVPAAYAPGHPRRNNPKGLYVSKQVQRVPARRPRVFTVSGLTEGTSLPIWNYSRVEGDCIVPQPSDKGHAPYSTATKNLELPCRSSEPT
jgi:hypothetical protein